MFKVFRNMCRRHDCTKLTKGSSTAMGMAASQARFLGLTARKNNVEFEGQQINQQRTTLSNQSANYYNNLLGMSVPIPPSVDDYTKTVYSFEDGALTNQITAMIAQPNGEYIVSYLRQWTDDFSAVTASTSIVNGGKEGPWKVGAVQLREMGKDLEEFKGLTFDTYFQINGNRLTSTETTGDITTYTYQEDGLDKTIYFNTSTNKWYSDENATTELKPENSPSLKTSIIGKYEGNDEYLKELSNDQIQQLLKEENEYIELLKNKYGQDSEYMVRYIKNSTTGEYNPYFYKKNDLTGALYDKKTGNSQSNINCYKIGSETKTEEVKALPGCRIEKDSSGRYINITIPAYNADGTIDANGHAITYALSTETTTDQAAYEDAMNQYEYEKYEYDQAIQEINAKIEIIQSQDKNLELRLKQLDTEQKAISTEIESVSSVIQKNTESSFKTFG